MGLASPRLASPGPGQWTVTDLDSRLAVSAGKLVISGASATWDRTMLLLQTPYTRHKGRYLEAQFTPTANNQDMTIGWQNVPDARIAYHECGVRFGGDGNIFVADGNGAYVNMQYPYSAGVSYDVRLYDGGPPSMKAGGWGDFFAYVKPASSSSWTLLWRKPASAGPLTQVYAGLNNIGHAGTMDAVRIRLSTLLPLMAFVALPVAGQLTCGAADGISEVLVEAPASGSASLTFRGDGATNFYSLTMDVDHAALVLSKTVAGVPTTIASKSVHWRPLKPYLLRAVCFGNYARTFVGRVLGPATTDSFNATAVAVGVTGAANFYNLRCDPSGPLLW